MLLAPTYIGVESVAGAIGIRESAGTTNSKSPPSSGDWLWNEFSFKCSGSIVMRSTVTVPTDLLLVACHAFYVNGDRLLCESKLLHILRERLLDIFWMALCAWSGWDIKIFDTMTVEYVCYMLPCCVLLQFRYHLECRWLLLCREGADSLRLLPYCWVLHMRIQLALM